MMPRRPACCGATPPTKNRSRSQSAPRCPGRTGRTTRPPCACGSQSRSTRPLSMHRRFVSQPAAARPCPLQFATWTRAAAGLCLCANTLAVRECAHVDCHAGSERSERQRDGSRLLCELHRGGRVIHAIPAAVRHGLSTRSGGPYSLPQDASSRTFTRNQRAGVEYLLCFSRRPAEEVRRWGTCVRH